MKLEKRDIVILILSILLVVCINLKFSNTENVDNSFFEEQIHSLHKENNILKSKIDSIMSINNNVFYKKIDSLQSLKPKINIKYVTKYKEIDNSSHNELILLSDSIFTANGIK